MYPVTLWLMLVIKMELDCNSAFSLFLILISAHIIADFLLQTTNDVRNKHRIPFLLKHMVTVGLMTWILSGVWESWLLPLITAVSHAVVDGIKVIAIRKGVATPLVTSK